jgi:hypothetical protein
MNSGQSAVVPHTLTISNDGVAGNDRVLVIKDVTNFITSSCRDARTLPGEFHVYCIAVCFAWR